MVYAASNSLGPATIRRCSFPAGAATCPAGTEQAISVPGGSPRTEAFALSDMDGDGLPELCTYDPHAQTVRCARSLSGYTSFHTVSFSNPTFPYKISGGVLL